MALLFLITTVPLVVVVAPLGFFAFWAKEEEHDGDEDEDGGDGVDLGTGRALRRLGEFNLGVEVLVIMVPEVQPLVLDPPGVRGRVLLEWGRFNSLQETRREKKCVKKQSGNEASPIQGEKLVIFASSHDLSNYKHEATPYLYYYVQRHKGMMTIVRSNCMSVKGFYDPDKKHS